MNTDTATKLRLLLSDETVSVQEWVARNRIPFEGAE